MGEVRGAPQVVVLGGPNGAGKSTVAPDLLGKALGIREFVNADQIASGLSAFNTESVAFEAGRLMLNRLKELGRDQVSFAFESTLSSRSFHNFLRRLKADGYMVTVIYVALSSAELAIARVKHRVTTGGHDVPEEIVRRRFGRSLKNLFELYLPIADEWQVLDNSGSKNPAPVAKFVRGKLKVQARKKWQNLQNMAQNAP